MSEAPEVHITEYSSNYDQITDQKEWEIIAETYGCEVSVWMQKPIPIENFEAATSGAKSTLEDNGAFQKDSKVIDRSNGEIDSYYFETEGGVDSISIQGDNITETDILIAMKDMVKEMKEHDHI